MSRWVGAGLVTALLAGLVQLVAIVGAPSAWACSCVAVSEAQHLGNADTVFAGTVTDRRIRWSRRAEHSTITVTFDVSRVYKGEVGATAYVVSLGGQAKGVVSSCDMNYGTAQWLVYAVDRGRDGLYASACGGTRPLRKKLPAVLGAGHKPTFDPPAFRTEPEPAPPGLNPTHPIYEPPDVTPWLAAGGAGLLLLVLPGWLAWRAKRMRAIVADHAGGPGTG